MSTRHSNLFRQTAVSKIVVHSRLTIAPEETKHVLGVQGQLWGEYISTPRHLEYMAYPRAAALAEVGWSPKRSKEYEDFLIRLRHHIGRLRAIGICYRPAESEK